MPGTALMRADLKHTIPTNTAPMHTSLNPMEPGASVPPVVTTLPLTNTLAKVSTVFILNQLFTVQIKQPSVKQEVL